MQLINKDYQKKKFFIIIFSFLISILISTYFVFQYDSYQLDGFTHIMLKEETFYHWFEAANIIEQLKNDINFFIAGNEVFTKPLPQRIVALYSAILNFEIMDIETERMNLGFKLPFLIFQSIVYYSSVIFFFKNIGNYLNERTKIFILLFLCLEPTLLQYHSSFWTESFYFSLQLIIFGLTIKENKRLSDYLLLGVVLGFLFLQRSTGIFYIYCLLFFFFVFAKENKSKILLLILCPYILICALLGFHNYLRAGTFYIMPTEGKYGMYRYFTKDILASKKNKDLTEINISELKKAKEWIDINIPKANDYNLELDNSLLGLARSIKNEKLRIKFYNYISNRNKEILLDNPIEVVKRAFKGTIHFSVLNPFFVYYDFEYFKNYSSQVIGDFYFSDKHKELIPYRIFYSLIIFIIVAFGVLKLLKQNLKLTILCLLSIIYYYILLGWYGKTRLFVPTLIYFSIFFGTGLDFLITKIKLFSQKKKN